MLIKAVVPVTVWNSKRTNIRSDGNLRGLKQYEEKKAAKLGFASLYEYFEDKIEKETKALEKDQADKTKLKKTLKTNEAAKNQVGSCR